ncbi:MAG: hypothetical protein IPF94_07110 [Betaproteobacteria bacterium]|nr:hypothetical protein [Betaproteobacteria bacterium]
MTRLLGADPAPQTVEVTPAPARDSRLRLIGVISTNMTMDGHAVALIQVDDQPARAYRLGEAVESDAVLLEIHHRGASVGPRGGPAAFTLALAEPPTAGAASPPAHQAGRSLSPLARPVQRLAAPQPMANDGTEPDVAPNVLLNNPSDMAPANAAGTAQVP